MCSQNLKEKNTTLRWEDLVVLPKPQQRRRLLERMASSEAGRERFWCKVKIGGADECWHWTSGLFNDGDGYGKFAVCMGAHKKIIKHRYRAHRVAYFLTHKNLPEHLCVCHTCDNPPCCNPAHLFLGTPRQNAYDRNDKQRDAKGEQHGMHKLTADQVREIRRLRATQRISQTALGKMFGVSHNQIGMIERRLNWKHLK